MDSRTNDTPSPGLRATLMRAWSAGWTVAKESAKPKPVTLEGYLLPRHMHHNRSEIEAGEVCGCICCRQIFSKREIRAWVGGGSTAVCPRCSNTTVVGSSAGFKLTPQLLDRAHQMLFEGRGKRA